MLYHSGHTTRRARSTDLASPITAETYNPTEAGSRLDGAGPSSSSRLLHLAASGNELTSESRMAFWLAPGEDSDGNPAKNTTVLSDHLLRKRVKIGVLGLDHLIGYDVTFTLPPDEHHTHAVFEALTGYMPETFSRFWTLAADGTLHPLDPGPGEQRDPVIFSTPDGAFAMGVFSPDQPSPGFESSGYGRFAFDWAHVVKWNCVFRVSDPVNLKPGEYTFHMFVAVGTLVMITRLVPGFLERLLQDQKGQITVLYCLGAFLGSMIFAWRAMRHVAGTLRDEASAQQATATEDALT